MANLKFSLPAGADYPMVFNAEEVNVIPFSLLGNSDIDLLIRRDDDSEGQLLSTFTEMGRTECVLDPTKGGYTVKDHLAGYSSQEVVVTDLKLPNKPAKGDKVPKPRPKLPMRCLIAKVAHNATDTVRLGYLQPDDTFPIVIITTDEKGYTRFDPGCTVKVDSSYGTSPFDVSMRPISKGRLQKMFFPLYDEMQEKEKAYKKTLDAYKEEYVDKFSKGEYDQAFVSMFSCRGTELRYTDTVIDFLRVKKRPDLLKWVARQSSRDGFEDLLLGIVKFCKKVKVNGIKVSYEIKISIARRTDDVGTPYEQESELQYVNGKKIAAADVRDAISRVTCHQDQASYDAFIKEVSKISMKFHRAVTYGVPLRDVNLFDALERDEIIKLPHDNSSVTCRLKVKKKAGKKAQVFLAGEWRRIKNFDMFVERAGPGRPKGGRYYPTIERGGVMLTTIESQALAKLSALDNFLVDADQVYPADVQAERYDRPALIYADESKEHAQLIGAEYKDMFADSINEQSKIINRSKEMLDAVVKQETVEIEQVTEPDGSIDIHYLVTGRSGLRYRIEQKSGAVIDLLSGNHICIVNGGARDMAGYDYITSLIHALAHDNRTAKKVGTLVKRTDEQEARVATHAPEPEEEAAEALAS